MTEAKMIAVGIDPDTKSTGWATVQSFNGGFQVLGVGLIRAKGRLCADRRIEMAYQLDVELHEVACSLPYSPTAVVVEWMKLRPRGEKRPNNIVDLNGISGMCVSAGLQFEAQHLLTPVPSEWKGTVPKKIMWNRIVSRLHLNLDLSYEAGYGKGSIQGAKEVPASMRTHVIDALGLACWALDPYGPIYDMRAKARATAQK